MFTLMFTTCVYQTGKHCLHVATLSQLFLRGENYSNVRLTAQFNLHDAFARFKFPFRSLSTFHISLRFEK